MGLFAACKEARDPELAECPLTARRVEELFTAGGDALN